MIDIVIQVEHLRKEFGEERAKVVAVDDISFKVAPGEVVLIFGPSGSGKTTLLSMIGCILTPSKGEVILLGEKLSEIQEKELVKFRRDKIGFVFQSFNLLHSLTVLENIEVALNLSGIKGKVAKAKAKEALEEVGLGDRLDFYPLDLSGGERQRVSIARALVKNPRIILADEPTGNFDSKTGQRIATLLQSIAKERNVAIIIVTHDNRIEHIADRLLYLEDGLIKEEKKTT